MVLLVLLCFTPKDGVDKLEDRLYPDVPKETSAMVDLRDAIDQMATAVVVPTGRTALIASPRQDGWRRPRFTKGLKAAQVPARDSKPPLSIKSKYCYSDTLFIIRWVKTIWHILIAPQVDQGQNRSSVRCLAAIKGQSILTMIR